MKMYEGGGIHPPGQIGLNYYYYPFRGTYPTKMKDFAVLNCYKPRALIFASSFNSLKVDA